MKAFNWLSRLRKDTRGNVIAIGVTAMPMLIAAAAIGVDTIQISLWKSQLQRSADSSALAGAYALSQGKNVNAAVNRSIVLNDAIVPTTIDARNAPTAGPFTGDATAVRVVLTAQRTAPFMAFFGTTPPNVRVEATARVIVPGEFCMLSLYEGTDPGIDANGGANVTLGCGIAANSRGTNSIEAGGNSSITADPIIAVGGITSGQNFLGTPKILANSSKQLDPFASVPDPVVPSGCSSAQLTQGNVPTVAGTYCFAGINIQPSQSITLPSGTTIIVNGGDVDLQGDFTALKSTIVMTGPGGAAGDLRINAQANITMTAPNSGPYQKIIIFRDRRAANIEVSINGGADSVLEGALYFPTSDIKFAGNAGMDVACLQMVGQKLKFRGGATITNICPAGSGADGLAGRIVRLVA
jgi:Flp pilus assembly protein TadG